MGTVKFKGVVAEFLGSDKGESFCCGVYEFICMKLVLPLMALKAYKETSATFMTRGITLTLRKATTKGLG